MEQTKFPQKQEDALNDWDRKYLTEGTQGVIKNMFADFEGNFPDVILLPETAARPLYYLFGPIFKKLAEEKKTKIPKFVFFNAGKNPYGPQVYLERHSLEKKEIKTAGDFAEAALEFNKNNIDENKNFSTQEIKEGQEKGQFEETAIARDVMKERADEIKNYMSANPNLKMAIVDDFHGYQVSLDEVKRAFGTREIHAYSLGSSSHSINRGDGKFEAKSGYQFSDNEEANPDKQKPNGENALRFSYAVSDAIGVKKNHDSKYTEVIKPTDSVESLKLVKEKAQLREEMKSLGQNIADNLSI